MIQLCRICMRKSMDLSLAKLSGHHNGAAIRSTVMYAQCNDTQGRTRAFHFRKVAMSHREDDAYVTHASAPFREYAR